MTNALRDALQLAVDTTDGGGLKRKVRRRLVARQYRLKTKDQRGKKRYRLEGAA